MVIPIRIFQNQDAVLSAQEVLLHLFRRSVLRGIPHASGIGDSLHHPEASAVIVTKGDRLDDVGLSSKHVDLEARR
jgi:hypothetical protein